MKIQRLGKALSTCLWLLAFSCKAPELIKQEGRLYRVVDGQGGLFVYLPYHWKGGGFSESIQLERDFVAWGKERNLVVQAMGRFPGTHDWELGFLARKLPEALNFQGFAIESRTLPAGEYASLAGRGNADYYFLYWKKLRRTLIKDGYEVLSPVLEIYSDILDPEIPEEKQQGEIRYRVKKMP